VDQETAAGLLSVLPGKIARRMTQREDENEHSIEMQLPFLAHLMAGARGAAWQSSATIVPIMVGRIGGSAAGGSKVADVLAAALAPFLADASNLFVISSDFCHWGDRFDFQPYASVRDRERLAPEMRGTGSSACPDIGDCIEHLDRTGMEVSAGAGLAVAACSQRSVTSRHGLFTAVAGRLLRLSLQLIEAKDASKFDRYCSETGNTICGRNPISLFLRTVSAAGLAAATNVRFLHYAQSSHVTDPDDSSVSYAAAAAVIAAGASDEPHTRATAEAGAAGSGAPREL
jgi:AmmeMemoRadiSam system protein B